MVTPDSNTDEDHRNLPCSPTDVDLEALGGRDWLATVPQLSLYGLGANLIIIPE
jgi:hypothetical protein